MSCLIHSILLTRAISSLITTSDIHDIILYDLRLSDILHLFSAFFVFPDLGHANVDFTALKKTINIRTPVPLESLPLPYEGGPTLGASVAAAEVV